MQIKIIGLKLDYWLQKQIPKLFGAKLAGDPEAECTLIIIEGASTIPIVVSYFYYFFWTF